MPTRRPKLVPMVFTHMCCGDGFVFGQDANGENYKRLASAPGSQPWEPVVPALGLPAAKRRTSDRTAELRNKRAPTKRSRGRVG